MKNRVKNTTRNIVLSYSFLIVKIVFQFVSKKVIVYSLGAQYLGLSGLFQSILHVLNLTELGFSSAIVYNMYKPISRNDTEQVCALMNYYKKIYRAVGLIILIIGLWLTPFIPKLIKGGVPSDINIYVLYLLYLLNTSSSYFLFGYCDALLHATQRMDLTKLAGFIALLFQNITQIIVLLIWKNYYAFVCLLIAGTVITNIVNWYYSKKFFPQFVCKGILDSETKKNIKHKVKGLLVCNLSSVTYTSCDTIIISSFIGLSSVAKYTNYITIYTAVASVITLIRGAMQASVGDSVASESINKNYGDMLRWQFMFSAIATVCLSCLVCLYQPFMSIWMGEDMLLPIRDVYLLGIWFLISVVQHAYYLYLTGNGMWHEIKWSYVFSTGFNIVMNIVLGKLMGVTGIILASALSVFISGSIWQCIVVLKSYFHKSPKEYFVRQAKYFFVAGIACICSDYICSSISFVGVIGLLVKAVVCVIISGLVLWIAFYRSTIYRQTKGWVLSIIQNKR